MTSMWRCSTEPSSEAASGLAHGIASEDPVAGDNMHVLGNPLTSTIACEAEVVDEDSEGKVVTECD